MSVPQLRSCKLSSQTVAIVAKLPDTTPERLKFRGFRGHYRLAAWQALGWEATQGAVGVEPHTSTRSRELRSSRSGIEIPSSELDSTFDGPIRNK